MSNNRMPAVLLAGLLAGTAAVPAAWAQSSSFTLSKVIINGNQQIPTDELLAALPIQPGQPITREGIQEESNAVGAVYRKHNVGASISSRATMQGHKMVLEYTVAEQAPVAARHIGNVADTVTVQGNKKISTADILAAAKIQPGGPVTTESLAAAQAAIVALYHKKNIGASVGYDFTNAAQPGHVNIIFKITEKDDE